MYFFDEIFGYMNYFLYLCIVKQKTMTTMAKKIVEEMLLTDVKVFGDDNEHAYNVTCEDGHATAVPTDEELEENPDAPKQLEMTYPKLADLSVYAKEDCLHYRGIYDMPYTSCDCSDEIRRNQSKITH